MEDLKLAEEFLEDCIKLALRENGPVYVYRFRTTVEGPWSYAATPRMVPNDDRPRALRELRQAFGVPDETTIDDFGLCMIISFSTPLTKVSRGTFEGVVTCERVTKH